MKKVLIVITSLYNGGAERSLVNFLNEMESNRYQIDLLLFKKEGLFLSQIPEWVNILDTPNDIMDLYGSKEKHKKRIRNVFTRYWGTAMSRLACKNRRECAAYRWHHFFSKKVNMLSGDYDYAMAYVSGDILYYVSEKVNAKKKSVWVHNDYRTAQHPKKYDTPHFEKMDAIISISDICVDILKEEFPKLADRMWMIPNITSSIVVRNRAAEFVPYEYDNKKNIILSIGRLSYQKGFDIAIKAAKILKQKGIEFNWFFLGDGEDKDSLQSLIDVNELKECVQLIGTRENPYPYIKNCTIFAQTSRYEGKSVVLDEAKILAKPILATNYPTVGDQLQSDVEGLVVDMNEKGIAEGIETLILNAELRNRLSSYLEQHEYGNQKEIKKYIDVIELK